MVNRRLLRIKIVQVLYSHAKAEGKTLNSAEKELFFSLEKTHELYYYFLLLAADLTDYSRRKIEQNKAKKLPSETDLNPNTRFIDNRVIAQMESCVQYQKFLNEHKLSWINYPELIRNIFNLIAESNIYKEYMENPVDSYEEDKRLWVRIFKKIIAENEDLGNVLEEISIYWNDDAELILSMVQKTFKRFDESKGEDQPLMPLFKDEDDRGYASTLFRDAVLNKAKYHELIHNAAKNWDVERLAFMDILIMEVAIAEAINFPNVPIKVSLNEFIEIAKFYSTEKSGVFVNGVLDKIFTDLKKEGIINKSGRGLLD